MIVGGFGAPLFLLLAGVAVALSAGSKLARGPATRARRPRRSCGAVSRSSCSPSCFACRPGSWAGALAADAAEGRHPQHHGAVDCRLRPRSGGPSARRARGSWRSPRPRWPSSLLTPIVRVTPLARPAARSARGLHPSDSRAHELLRLPLGRVRVRRRPGRRAAGRRARARRGNAPRTVRLFAGGAALALGAYAASFLPSPYAQSEFWTTSPAFFLLRVGIVTAALGARLRVERTPARVPGLEPAPAARPVVAVHLLDPRGDGLRADLAAASQEPDASGRPAPALVAFAAFMLVCSIAKERVAAWWSEQDAAV